jgi:hypothetical protein
MMMSITLWLLSSALLAAGEVPDGVCRESHEGACVKQSSSACIKFDLADFTADSKSIFYGQAKGRLGNQLLGFALMHHFRHVVGVDAYIHGSAKEYITKVFTEGD